MYPVYKNSRQPIKNPNPCHSINSFINLECTMLTYLAEERPDIICNMRADRRQDDSLRLYKLHYQISVYIILCQLSILIPRRLKLKETSLYCLFKQEFIIVSFRLVYTMVHLAERIELEICVSSYHRLIVRAARQLITFSLLTQD